MQPKSVITVKERNTTYHPYEQICKSASPNGNKIVSKTGNNNCLNLFIDYLPTNSVYKFILVIVQYVDEEIRCGRVVSLLLENFSLIRDFCNVAVIVFAPDIPLKIVDIDPVMTEAHSA